MRLLDLFCGAGGAAMGYSRAGFEPYGVDNNPKPLRHYPFPHVCMDALEAMDRLLVGEGITFNNGQPFGRTLYLNQFDAIHASPPCQAYSVMRSLKHRKDHPDMVADVRERLEASRLPYVIENVPGAPLRNYFSLCGSMFGLRSHRGFLQRHRLFEVGNTDVLILTPPCAHQGVAIGVYGHGSAGWLGQRMRTANRDEARVLMGTPEMHQDGMSQAIPPVYCEYIGRALRASMVKL